MLKLLFSVKRLAPSAQLELIQLVSIRKPEKRDREREREMDLKIKKYLYEKIKIFMI